MAFIVQFFCSWLILVVILFATNLYAKTTDIIFPDEISRQVHESYQVDVEQYEELYRPSHYHYEHPNTHKLACSFDKSPIYEDVEQCVLDLLKDGGWLIVGDSHGRDLYNTLKMVYPKKNIAMFHQSSCAPAKMKVGKKVCFKDISKIADFINTSSSVQKVIFASRFHREPGTEQFIKDIKGGAYSKNVIIFNAGPAIHPNPIEYVQQFGAQEGV